MVRCRRGVARYDDGPEHNGDNTMVEEIDLGQAVTNQGEESTSGGSGGVRAPVIDTVDPGVAELVFQLLEQATGNEFEVWAFDDDAESDGKVVTENIAEALGLPEDVETFSFEDFFQVDMSDYDYFGNPPRERDEEGNTEIPDDWKEMTGNGAILKDAKVALNGNYAAEIQERFGSDDADEDNPEVMVAIRIGKASKHEDDYEQRQHAVFYIQETDMTPKRVLKARKDVEDITESEYEERLEALGFDD